MEARGIDTYDSVQTLVTFENGCTWTVENSWIYPSGFPKANDSRTVILVENGLFLIDSQNRGVELYDHERCKTPNSYFIGEVDGRFFDFGIEPIKDFLYCLMKDKPFVAGCL